MDLKRLVVCSFILLVCVQLFEIYIKFCDWSFHLSYCPLSKQHVINIDFWIFSEKSVFSLCFATFRLRKIQPTSTCLNMYNYWASYLAIDIPYRLGTGFTFTLNMYLVALFTSFSRNMDSLEIQHFVVILSKYCLGLHIYTLKAQFTGELNRLSLLWW